MGYIDKNLMNRERIVYRTHLHWVVFLRPAIFLLVAICLFIVGGDAAIVGMILILVGIVSSISSLINYKSSEFGITNKRVLAKVGFIRRQSLEVLLTKIEGIQVNQGILGRILNYGSIIISGTGGTKDPFKRIKAPLGFRKRAQEELAAVQDAI